MPMSLTPVFFLRTTVRGISMIPTLGGSRRGLDKDPGRSIRNDDPSMTSFKRSPRITELDKNYFTI